METASSYSPEWFQATADAEDRHFWFVARNAALQTVLAAVLERLPATTSILEVGCGTGNVLRVLESVSQGRPLIGMDLFLEGLQFARTRVSCPLVQAGISRPPFSTQFGLIGLFDVLEHLPNDDRVLRDLRAMLAPGGALVLTVPAHQSLWSYFDEASHHCRRYAEDELRAKLLAADYQVEYLTPLFALLLPLMRLQRGSQAKRKSETATDDLRIVPGVNEALTILLRAELPLLRRGRRIPFGTSLLAVARKA